LLYSFRLLLQLPVLEKMKWILILIVCLWLPNILWGQDLFSERIRKIACNKTSVFVKQGIFYNQGDKKPYKLNALRHSYTKSNGYERIVFDFDSSDLPRIYGHIKSQENKLFIDMFNTELKAGIKSFGTSKYVKDVKVFPVSSDMLTMEFGLKQNVEFDIFCLKSPGRLVIDIK